MRRLLLVAAFGLHIPGASAAPMTVTGDVVAVQSHWTADGSRIVTDATIQPDFGDPIVVRQLGGTVDGLTMRTMPGPEPLVLGMRVTTLAHEGLDLAQQAHIDVDDVKVLADAPGFVRTGPTQAGHYLYWESGCAFVTYDSAGTKAIAGDAEFAVIDASIATWNNDVASCSYIKVMKRDQKPMEVGRDNTNVIKFRDDMWCRPATGDDSMKCYASSAAGITTATYVDDGGSSRDGAIVDADIEINGVNFAISVNGQSLSNAPCQAELQNTMTHELGHLHGLEHTCLAPGDPARIDDKGGAVPACSQTSDPKITEATMFNFQMCGETKKETLEADDINAICVIYPNANDPGTCEPVKAIGPTCGGCDSGHPAAGLALAGAVGLLLRRRRRA